jgi:hypothetical protein
MIYVMQHFNKGTSPPGWQEWAILANSFLKITKEAQILGLFLHIYGRALVVTKNGLDYVWGHYFANSIGHPDFHMDGFRLFSDWIITTASLTR